MKKVISIIILLTVLFLIGELLVVFFTKEYEYTYKIYTNDKEYIVTEIYSKDMDDSYDVSVSVDDNNFYYLIKNNFNKQKKIIKSFEYFEKDSNICIYPILVDDSNTYIECISNNKLYYSYTYPDQNFIKEIEGTLKEKGYNLEILNSDKTTSYNNSIIYKDNLIDSDMIALWQYKGINTISKKLNTQQMLLSFDKYENTNGYLVDKYYVIPNYSSSKVLEFSSISIVDIEKNEVSKIDLECTLSSNTYINGVVDNKLYYTDPSNLIQMEINPVTKKARIIGNNTVGGQIYDGTWKNYNIYEFVSNKIKFEDLSEVKKYNYKEVKVSNSSYYLYNDEGLVYQVLKNHIDSPILMLKEKNINNINAIGDTLYYVLDDTLYYTKPGINKVAILKNNDLRYNTFNRIQIYRNKSLTRNS